MSDGVELHAHDLRRIADALEQYAKAPARIGSFDLEHVRVHVKSHDDQRDGRSYTVVAITRV